MDRSSSDAAHQVSRNFEMLFRNQHGWSHGSPQHGFLGFYNSPGYPKQYNKANKRWVSSLRKQKQRIRRIGRLVQFLPKRALPSSTFVRRLSLLLLLNAQWEQTADCSGLLASIHTDRTSSQKRSDALLPWRYSIKLSTSTSHTVAVCARTDAVISRKRQAFTN